MDRFVTVARSRDVPPGTMRAVQVGQTPILLANVDGIVHACGGWCTHRGAPLDEGNLWEATVSCPYHGGQFDVQTGAVLAGPPLDPLPTYPVRVSGDAIQIRLP